MRTIYIMVEGQTEEQFINELLSYHLRIAGITNAVPILLETSPGYYGGDVSFARYSLNAKNLLQRDPHAIVTSLIDYFQLRTDFPGYNHSLTIADKSDRMDYLEEQIANIIQNERFEPYIQLHEFEGLLFSDIRGFQAISKAKLNTAQYILNHFPNPELINDGTETAPSVRLKKIIPRYHKKVHGPFIALENGINVVLAKCPRFKNWIDAIVAKATTD